MNAKEIAEEILRGTVTMKSATDIAKAYLSQADKIQGLVNVAERCPIFTRGNEARTHINADIVGWVNDLSQTLTAYKEGK